MEFAALVAILALFMSMGAMWLTGGLLRKLDEQTQIFLQTHVKSLRQDVKAIDSRLHQTDRTISTLEKNRADMQAYLQEHSEQISHLNNELAKLNSQILDLENSIPDRYRIRTTTKPPKPAPAKTA